MSMKQVTSVVHFTREVLGDAFQPGVDIKTYVTKVQRKEIVERVTDSLADGETELSAEARLKYNTREKLRTYTNGMVTNWFNKSKELNGGTKFEYKNPGSRAGMGDAQLRELKKLKTQLETKGAEAEQIARVDEAIAEREATVKAAKASKVEVNGEVIPDHLKDLLSA